jgi:hypothetical protein
MARLTELVHAAQSGRSAFVSLVGDPGIGKTQLAQEFLAVARDAGAAVGEGRCHEETAEIAFRPWTQALRSLLGRPTAADLYQLLGLAQGDLSLGEEVHLSEGPTPLKQRIELFDAVVRSLVDHSGGAPLVLLIEDVHWMDSASLLLLRFVASEISALGVAIVVTHRPEQLYSDRAFARAARAWQSETLHVRLDLQGLDHDDAVELVRQEAVRLVAREVTPELIKQSGGNPLLLIQLVRHVVESRSGADSWSKRRPAVALELPSDVRDLILRRIEALGGGARQALEAAACTGSVFEYAQLRATVCELGGTANDLRDSLDEACTAGLIEEDTGIATHRFTHALIRESLLGSIPARRKRMIHGAIIAAIESVHAAQIEAHLPELARHSYEGATGTGILKAVQYAAAEAARAYRSCAFEEAALWFAREIEIIRLNDPSDQRSQAEALFGLGQSLSMAGRGRDAIEKFNEGLGMARALGHWRLFGWCVYGICVQWSVNSIVRFGESGNDSLLLEAIERAEPDDLTLRAALVARLGAERGRNDPQRGAATARQGLELAFAQDNVRVRSNARIALRVADWRPDNLGDRLALSRQAVQALRDIGEAVDLTACLPLLIIDLLESGAAEDAKIETEHYRALANRILNPFFLWQLGVIEAMWLMLAGAFDAAERHAQAAFNLGFEHNPADSGAIFGAFNFALAWWRGDLAAYEQPLRDIMSQLPVVPAWRAGLALICAETGKCDLAREQLDLLAAAGFDAIPPDATYLTTVTLLAECAHRLEDAALARHLQPLLAPFEDHLVIVGNAVACHGSVAGFLACLRGLAGDLDGAAHAFAKAVALETGIGSRPLATKTRANWLELQARANRHTADFAALLSRTRAEASALGMAAVVARLDALGAARGATPDRALEPGGTAQRGELATFQSRGEFRTIRFAAQEIQLKDTKGMAYLEHLLRHPGRDFFALELVGLLSDGGEATPRAGDAGEILDARAVAEYRRRVADLRGELDEADAANDQGRASRLREEIEILSEQLGEALGLGGRRRKAAADSERARVNVTRAIRSSVRKIADAHPVLGRRLIHSIKTGNACCYEEDSERPILWEL